MTATPEGTKLKRCCKVTSNLFDFQFELMKQLGVNYCSMCGWDFRLGYWPHQTFEAVEAALKANTNASLRIVFDVDGVLAVEGPAYAKREAYADTIRILKLIKSYGHTIVIQTARYMVKYDGDQVKARANGYSELVLWLNDHDIPWDEVYLGKAAGDLYLDDKGCRLDAKNGTVEWLKNFVPSFENTRSFLPRKETDGARV